MTLPQPIIHRATKSILLPKSCDYLLSELQNVRMVTFGDKSVVQVKHDEANTLALRAKGWDVAAPIEVYYDWPKFQGRKDPMSHQKAGAAFHTLNPRSINQSQPRTGKSFTVLLAADWLIKSGKVKRVAIFSTLSTMDQVWVKSIFDSFHDYSYVSVHASTAAQRRDILESNTDFAIINHDGCKLLEKEIIAKKFDMVIWDEADNLTQSGSAMWKSFHKIAKDVPYVILMGATIVGERKPTDAWAIAKIINPDNVPKWWSEFRRQTCYQVTPFKWEPYPHANQIVAKALQPSFCVLKKDVMDIPELKVVRKECGLSEQQRKMFMDMKNKLAADIGDKKLMAINGADMLTKCLQILLGVYKADEDDYQPLDCQPRLDALLECIAATDKKAIVFCGFKGALNYYCKEVNKHYPSIMVDGSVQKKQRDAKFRDFAGKGGPKVLFAIPKTCAHGLEFGANCDTIIWLGPISSGKQFSQANERIASMLQESDMKMFYIGANNFEWKRYDQLEAKRDMATDILDLCKTVIGS